MSIHKPATKPADQRHRFSIRTEEQHGSPIAAAGTIWATYAATVDYAGLWRFQILPPGLIELCSLGILTWLQAEWRRSTKGVEPRRE